MYHIQNHIEILGYLTHSDPFQIFKIFNQCGHINKGLICKPLFYKIWCVYWYHFWYYGSHKWERLSIPACDEHTSKTFGRNFYTMCHQVLIEVLDLKLFVAISCQHSYWPGWALTPSLPVVGSRGTLPAHVEVCLHLHISTLQMEQHSKLLQNAPQCHIVQKPQYMFRIFVCTYVFVIMQCYKFFWQCT